MVLRNLWRDPLYKKADGVWEPEAWFGDENDFRYFPVNLCGWSTAANNFCPKGVFPEQPMLLAGKRFLVQDPEKNDGKAVLFLKPGESATVKFPHAVTADRFRLLGTQAFFVTNGESGDPSGVWDILTRTNAPSYAHMLRRKTNLCEQWEAEEGSFNHIMFGSVDAWLHECLAGLNVDFTHPEAPILFRPQPVRACVFAEATRVLPNGGTAVSSWRFDAEGRIHYRFVVPPGRRARLVLPDRSSS